MANRREVRKAGEDRPRARKGRPKLPEADRLSAVVYVLLSPSEREALDNYARQPAWRSRSKILRTAFRDWLEARRREEAREAEDSADGE